jgi:hypothetical protein
VKALGDYTAANEEELSFPKGASMFVAAKHNDKYWKGVYVVPHHRTQTAMCGCDRCPLAAHPVLLWSECDVC